MAKYAVAVTRMVKETGRAIIEVPDGADPREFLETLREVDDDCLEWSSDDVNDIAISCMPLDDSSVDDDGDPNYDGSRNLREGAGHADN